MEAALPNGRNDVCPETLQNLAPTDQERVDLVIFWIALLERRLAQGIALARRATFVDMNVVALKEDAVDGNDFPRLEEEDIADHDVVDGHEALRSVPDDLDVALFLLPLVARNQSQPYIEGTRRESQLRVELLELSLFLVVVDWGGEVSVRRRREEKRDRPDPTMTTMKMAIVIATPSTQSTYVPNEPDRRA